MRRKRRWRRVLYFFLGLFLAYGAVCYYLASQYVRPGIANEGPLPAGFTTEKDLWVSDHLSDKKAVFVLAHGYGGTQSGWSQLAVELTARGYGVVIPAFPGHDDKTGETCGFGIKESQIVVDTVAWIRQQSKIQNQKPKIILLGVSMGGAACWLATEKDPTIDAIVTEGCFARLQPATDRWFNRKAPGASVYLRPVIWFASNLSGVNPADINPIEAAKKWKGKPCLVIHGENDNLFAAQDGMALAEASGTDLWIVPGASHAHCAEAAPQEYLKRITALAD